METPENQEVIKETTEDEESEEGTLTLKQRAFCELYAGTREFFGNGTQSYVEAYNPPRDSKFWYEAAAASASRLLRKAKVVREINKILEVQGLNDVAVDKQLSFLIAQHADFKSKMAAIKEYNKLKARIVDRADITSGGEPLVVQVSETIALKNDLNPGTEPDSE